MYRGRFLHKYAVFSAVAPPNKNLDLGPRPGPIDGLDGPGASPVVGPISDGHDALHLQGQLDPGLRWCDTDGERELALCVFTVGAARRVAGISKWIVWCCSIFSSSSDAVLYGSTHRRSDVDGGVLRLTTNEMESRERAGQVALGHLPIIVLLELPRVMCWFPGGFASRCFRCHTNITTDHDAVHGLRAAPEPDAALRQAVEVSQFVALVEQDFFNVEFSSYQ